MKADANPDYNNVAYTTTQQLGSFTVRCAELCGIWHGAMYNSGVVVTPQQFVSWAKLTEARLRKNTKLLPPYALTYTPDANGADGGYYPDNGPLLEGRAIWRRRSQREASERAWLSTRRSANPSTPARRRSGPPGPGPAWRRSPWLRPHILWAMAGAVIGYLIGHWLGNVIASGYDQVQTSQNDVAIVLGLVLGVAGWMTGIGAFNYPLAKILGYELSPPPTVRSWVRYFRMTEDHKVVGWQYAVGVLLFLFTGGFLAMIIRTQLLSPTSHAFGPGHLHRHRRASTARS